MTVLDQKFQFFKKNIVSSQTIPRKMGLREYLMWVYSPSYKHNSSLTPFTNKLKKKLDVRNACINYI